MAIQSIARATEPHLPSLVATLTPLLAVASAGSFTVRYQGGNVVIEQASFTGVNMTSVTNAVVAAPVTSPQLDAQDAIDNMPILQKAIVLALIDQLNVIRAALPSPLGAITPAQAVAAIRTKAGTL